MCDECNFYEISTKHRKEVLELINYSQFKSDLRCLEEYSPTVLKEYHSDYLSRTIWHEAGHKTIDNIIWPNVKIHYKFDLETGEPMVVIKNFYEIRDSFDDDFYGWHHTYMLSLLGGFAGEALYNKIDLNKLGEHITRLGMLKFYVGGKNDFDSDEYKAYREMIESHFNPFAEGPELKITDILKEACIILTDNEELFSKNATSAQTYFSKKIREYESKTNNKEPKKKDEPVVIDKEDIDKIIEEAYGSTNKI